MEAANRGLGGSRQDYRSQHRVAVRAGDKPVRLARAGLQLHYFFIGNSGLSIRPRRWWSFRAVSDMDELFEVLTLIQTKMPRKAMPVVLFGKEFWDEILNFEALVKWGVVGPLDLQIFHKTDSVDDAYQFLSSKLEDLYLSPKGLEKVKLT